VLVLEGRVEITGPAERANAAAPRPQLAAAERMVVPHDETAAAPLVEKVDAQVMHEAVAWHASVTTISNRPLREIVDLFNRRNRVHLVIGDPDLGERSMGGSFPIDQPQTFVRLLELDGDVISEQRGESEIVLRRKRS